MDETHLVLCQDVEPHFYLETVTGEIFSKKEEFALCICKFRESLPSSACKCWKVSFEKTRCGKMVG